MPLQAIPGNDCCPLPLADSLDVLVALAGGRLGDIDWVGTGKRLLQALFQGLIEPALFGIVVWLRLGA
jgi:hypothetical protein